MDSADCPVVPLTHDVSARVVGGQDLTTDRAPGVGKRVRRANALMARMCVTCGAIGAVLASWESERLGPRGLGHALHQVERQLPAGRGVADASRIRELLEYVVDIADLDRSPGCDVLLGPRLVGHK